MGWRDAFARGRRRARPGDDVHLVSVSVWSRVKEASVNQTLGDRSPFDEGTLDGEIEFPSSDHPVIPPVIGLIVSYVTEVVQNVGKRFLEADQEPYAEQRRLEEHLRSLTPSDPPVRPTPPSGAKGSRISPTVFWIFAISVVVLDFPLTLIVFEVIAPGDAWLTWLLAAGVQIVLFAAAKVAGILLHGAGTTKLGRALVGATVVLLAGLVAVATYSLASLRQDVVEAQLQDTGADVGDVLADQDEVEDEPEDEPDSPAASNDSFRAFAALLTLTFLVATLLAWLSHDPEGARRPWFWDAWRRWRASRVARKLKGLRAERRARFRVATTDADEWLLWSEVLQYSYWVGNHRARRNPITQVIAELGEQHVEISDPPWRGRDYDFGDDGGGVDDA